LPSYAARKASIRTCITVGPRSSWRRAKSGSHGGYIPGIRPGERTAEYIDYVLTRITVVGAAYLAVVCLIPEILISYAAVPFYFGGTSLLIVVSVAALSAAFRTSSTGSSAE
jgi:hypothetical protein